MGKTIIDLSDRFESSIKYRISTGIIALDRIIGGGIPSGRLTEFYGGESTAKSRLLAHILAQTQKIGGIAVLIDTERALDEGLIRLTGLDVKSLVYPSVDKIKSIEDIYQALEDTARIIRPKYPDAPIVFGWDSVAATPGHEDLVKEVGRSEASMRRAKLIGDGLRKYLASDIVKAQLTVVFINQIRERTDVMFGDKTDTPGGRAIKHAASLRIAMRIIGAIRDEETKEQIGTRLQLFVRKSRVSPPFGVINFEMYVDKPISQYAGLLDYMVRHKEVKQSGGWYSFLDEEKKFRASDFPKEYERWVNKTKKK